LGLNSVVITEANVDAFGYPNQIFAPVVYKK